MVDYGSLGLVVNKSNKELDVYSLTSNTKIGTIFPNEAYIGFDNTMVAGKYGRGIRFLSSSGVLKNGGVRETESIYGRSVCDFPYSGYYNDVPSRPIMKLRRTAQMYDYDGSEHGTLAAGTLVAVSPGFVGETKKECCMIFAYKNSAGVWKKLYSNNGNDYRFIDMGLAYGSYNHNITLYGTW